MCDQDNLQDANSEQFRPFVNKVVDHLVSYLEAERDDDSDVPVCDFITPTDLEVIIRPLAVQAEGATTDELLSNIRLILDKTVKTGHRDCINQLFHRADTMAILADWITSVINTSMYTYELGPVVTLMERNIIEMYRELLTWNSCEGFFSPGGSTSNLYALTLARARMFPYVQQEGWRGGENAKVFISECGHYSTTKAAAVLGMGYNAVVDVGTNEQNQMCPDKLRDALEKEVAAGNKPMCVTCTSGSTLTGAADRIEKILEVCAPYGVWVHVDGCFGGGLIHSPTHRHVLNGVEHADSFAINPHKMLGLTQQCSLFLTQREGTMRSNFATNAAYLFNADKQFDASYDLGDAIFQCGRKVDCLKLWMVWRQRGNNGMAAYIDRAVAANALLNDVLRTRAPEFKIMIDQHSIVPATCFWWIPEELAGNVDNMRDPVIFKQLDKVVPRAKAALMDQGRVILTNSMMQELPNFWRFIGNGGTKWTEKQFNDLLDDVAKACRYVYDKQQRSTNGSTEASA